MRASRLVAVAVFVLSATILHYSGGPFFGVSLILWFLLALGIGLMLPRWWSFSLAAIPWPVGVGLGLVTGRYTFLGDFWQVVALTSVLVGLGGITIGRGLRLRTGTTAASRRRPVSHQRARLSKSRMDL
jgi:hypothetical protein